MCMEVIHGSQFRTNLLQILLNVETAVNELITPAVKKEGLTLRQYYILLIIEEKKRTSIGVLANSVNLAQSNISIICKTLEGAGFIYRGRQKEDERIVEIYLTEKGTALMNKLNKEFDSLDKVLLEVSKERLELISNGYNEFSSLIKTLITFQKSV